MVYNSNVELLVNNKVNFYKNHMLNKQHQNLNKNYLNLMVLIENLYYQIMILILDLLIHKKIQKMKINYKQLQIS